MSYQGMEVSEQDGAPVELYEFFVGGTSIVHRYTSSESNVSWEGDTFASAPIRRTSIAISIEQSRNAIKVTVPRNNAVAELFRRYSPKEPVGLIVRRYHRGDSDVAVVWVGRVLNCIWASTSTAELNCEPVSISLNRLGLARAIQVPCPYAWAHEPAGVGCGLDRTDFDHATTIDSINGVTLVVDSVAALPYSGGWVEWSDGDSPPSYERRLIVAASGTTLTLVRPFSSDVLVNDAVTLFPGCDHTAGTCHGTYDNILNYGGFLFMPEKNPFDGQPVY